MSITYSYENSDVYALNTSIYATNCVPVEFSKCCPKQESVCATLLWPISYTKCGSNQQSQLEPSFIQTLLSVVHVANCFSIATAI